MLHTCKGTYQLTLLPIKWTKCTRSRGLGLNSTGRRYPLRSIGHNGCSHQPQVWPAYSASNGPVKYGLLPWQRCNKRRRNASGICLMTQWTGAWLPKLPGGGQASFQFYVDGSDHSPRPASTPSALPPPSVERSQERRWTITPACGVGTPATKRPWSCATVAMRAIIRTVRRNLRERGSMGGHGFVTPAKASSLYGEHRM